MALDKPLRILWEICFVHLILSVVHTSAKICGNLFYNMESCYANQVCCYSGNYAYCCKGLTYGAIVGIAIGCLAGLTLLIVFIIVCCCAMNKCKGMKGRVIYPRNPTGGVAVVNSHQQGFTNGSYGANPGYGYGGQPLSPAYPPTGTYQPTPSYPPPTYAETDPEKTPQQNS